MAIISNGVLVKSPSILQEFTPASWNGWPQSGITQAFRWGSYSSIYQRQLWVSVLVNKRGNATARLPIKVYRRGVQGREDARETPYGDLIRQPNTELDPFLFWLWVSSTKDVYGEAFLLKIRDRGGRPRELVPWHPTKMIDEVRDGRVVWQLDVAGERVGIDRRDFVHFRNYNPDSLHRGMSPLEPLRSTLENEEGARRANSAVWRNGGRPSVVLRHPGKFKDNDVADRLRTQWHDIHGGVDNWAKTAILEEGMEAQVISLNSEELQYVEARKLNREECCAAYDVPPPVVHILDRATFSNITEQMRSMYRDTMAPHLGLLESTLEMELRDGRFGDVRREPDFGSDVYAEFLLDEVLRGDFETRVQAMAQGINTGQLMPAEARQMENRPFVEGSDQLFINGAVVPLASAGEPAAPLPNQVVRTLMGRLSRQENLAEVDPAALVAGLNGHTRTVLIELDRAQSADLSVAQFRDRLRTLVEA